MNPWKASAQFAAFVWYLNRERPTPPDEAARLAKDNWIAFLPCADERIGKLLVTSDHVPEASPRRGRFAAQNQRHGRFAMTN